MNPFPHGLFPDGPFPHGATSYLFGGLLVGLGVSLIFLVTGRIAGASSFFSSTLSWCLSLPDLRQPGYLASRTWRVLFAAGLVLGALAYTAFAADGRAWITGVSPWRLAVGGLLVGLGTRVSRGCTSGHGICGLSSWSRPSLLAVLTFMGVAIVTAGLTRAAGLAPDTAGVEGPFVVSKTAVLVPLAIVAAAALRIGRAELATLAGGAVFGGGLAMSGMTRPEVVLDFLHLEDLGLALVMGGGVAVTMATFQLGRRLLAKPLAAPAFERYSAAMRPRTFGGAAVFGVGWGLSGLCPGSAIASLGIGNLPVLIGIATMFAGAWAQARFVSEPPRA